MWRCAPIGRLICCGRLAHARRPSHHNRDRPAASIGGPQASVNGGPATETAKSIAIAGNHTSDPAGPHAMGTTAASIVPGCNGFPTVANHVHDARYWCSVGPWLPKRPISAQFVSINSICYDMVHVLLIIPIKISASFDAHARQRLSRCPLEGPERRRIAPPTDARSSMCGGGGCVRAHRSDTSTLFGQGCETLRTIKPLTTSGTASIAHRASAWAPPPCRVCGEGT